tara:strand:- start:1480 stop:2076 length:597 start_codon:yes stop_codon:yes gene_type:complete
LNITIENLIAALNRLPGLGRRTSERIAYMLVQDKFGTAKVLARALQKLNEDIEFCSICGVITNIDNNPCSICNNKKRDFTKLCIVESSEELFKIEASKLYDGIYHVLNGKISPISGISINDIRIKELFDRIYSSDIKEVIFCLGDDVESAATVSYLKEKIKPLGKLISCIDLSVLNGAPIEYLEAKTLGKAIAQRSEI